LISLCGLLSTSQYFSWRLLFCQWTCFTISVLFVWFELTWKNWIWIFHLNPALRIRVMQGWPSRSVSPAAYLWQSYRYINRFLPVCQPWLFATVICLLRGTDKKGLRPRPVQLLEPTTKTNWAPDLTIFYIEFIPTMYTGAKFWLSISLVIVISWFLVIVFSFHL